MVAIRLEATHQACPGLEGTVADIGLSDVVDDETHLREIGDRAERCRNLADVKKEIIGEPSTTDSGESASHFLAKQPFGVGLVVYEMADAHQIAAVGAILQPRQHLTELRIGEINPADDPGNEVGFAAVVRKSSVS